MGQNVGVGEAAGPRDCVGAGKANEAWNGVLNDDWGGRSGFAGSRAPCAPAPCLDPRRINSWDIWTFSPCPVSFPTLPGDKCLRAAFAFLENKTVAHSLSAKKRVRQNLKRRARNRARKSMVRDQIKTYLGAVHDKDVTKAESELKKTVQVMDRMATKNTIHKNTAARRRSRLTKRLNALKAGAGQGTQAAKA
jgi:small subunit ribosomal protein S20